MNMHLHPVARSGRRMAHWASTGLLAALAACGGGGTSDPWTNRLPALEGATSLNWPDGSYSFRTAQEWADAWNAVPLYLPAPGQAHPAVPAVDFARRMVVGVAVTGSNGCSGLGIVGAQEDATQVVVTYRVINTPPPGMGCTAALVPLAHFTDIAASSKPVVFVRQDG